MSEDPNRQALEQMMRVLEQFRASELPRTDLRMPDGSTLAVEKISGQAPGMHFAMEGAFKGRVYEPTDIRPNDYPEELPFVPGTGVAVHSVPGKLKTACWTCISDRAGVRASIQAQLHEAGWSLAEEVPVPVTGMSMMTFRKGDCERQLMAADAMLILIQRGA